MTRPWLLDTENICICVNGVEGACIERCRYPRGSIWVEQGIFPARIKSNPQCWIDTTIHEPDSIAMLYIGNGLANETELEKRRRVLVWGGVLLDRCLSWPVALPIIAFICEVIGKSLSQHYRWEWEWELLECHVVQQYRDLEAINFKIKNLKAIPIWSLKKV